MCAKPIRLSLAISRYSTVADVKAKALDIVNALDQGPLGEEEEEAGGSRPFLSGALDRLPPLTVTHTTAMDVTGDDRGRIKKILENRCAPF